jgi:hypothetical protein
MGDIGLEPSLKMLEKQGVAAQRGTEYGTVGGNSGFAEATGSIMQLPLSDAEKAEAVRRLLR